MHVGPRDRVLVMKRRDIHPSPAEEAASVNDQRASDIPEAVTWLETHRWRLFGALLLFRCINAVLSYTAFVPDETWQSLEVSHSIVFGYGYRTWEWHMPIRGFTHPLIYAILYKALALLHLDWPCLLVVLPRVLHAPLAVVGDVYVLKLGTHLFGKRAGKYALLCNIASWFTFYCVTRTLSNSIETCLTPVVIYHWMNACELTNKVEVQRHSRVYLLMIGISCIIRPTGIPLWTPLVLAHLWIAVRVRLFWGVLRETVMLGLLTVAWSIAVDSYCYGKLVVVQWNFLEFNVLEGHSALYGADPWHWYFTEDCPVLLFTLLPLTLLGAWLCPSNWLRAPFWLAVWELVFHSALSHKEHRYVFPIVPVGVVYAGYCIVWLLQKYQHRLTRYLVYTLLLANVPMALYFSLVHQRGTVAVMDYIREDVQSNSSVLFLMPCHSTPYYSHIHQPIKMEFLECPPPIRDDYVDLGKQFYSQPSSWLNSRYPTPESAPSHIVLFEEIVQEVHGFLSALNYTEVVKLFHTHFPEDKRRSSYLVLLKR